MEKRGQIYEFTIKLIYAILSIIAAVFVVKNAILMLPLFKSFSYTELELYDILYSTHIGSIFFDMGIIDTITWNTIVSALVSFISNIEWISIVFLFTTIILLILFFTFVKWSFVGTYIKLSFYLILGYLFKYILFSLCFVLFYKEDLTSIALSLLLGTCVYMIASLFELVILSMFIIKCIFNFPSDIKSIFSH